MNPAPIGRQAPSPASTTVPWACFYNDPLSLKGMSPAPGIPGGQTPALVFMS